MYTVYSDNLLEAEWFIALDTRLDGARVEILGPRGSHPDAINDLLVYDRPDIILCKDANPVLTVEKTREVPTGHNVGQRVARLVRSLEFGIPAIKFFPFDARKHGRHSSICSLNVRLLAAFERMTHIHQVPMLACNWPADANGELMIDGSENERISELVSSFLSAGCSSWWPEAEQQLELLSKEYAERVAAYRNYANPPKSVVIGASRDLYRRFTEFEYLTIDEQQDLFGCEETVLYTIGMTPEKSRREDPYTGTQFIYDYAWCRNGARPENKSRNLVLRFPEISRDTWLRNNPDDSARKSSNWYLTANALLFSDGAIFLRKSSA